MAHTGETARTLARQAEKFLDTLDTRTSMFLDSKGEWRGSPRSLEECASHEILFQCLRLDDSQRTSCFQDISSCLNQAFGMDEQEKIRQALDEGSDPTPCDQPSSSDAEVQPFLTLFRILTWCMAAEAMRINSRRGVPEWNQAAKAECRSYRERLQRLNAQAGKYCSTHVKASLLTDLYDRLVPALPERFCSLPGLLAEEDRLACSIEGLLAAAQDLTRREEAYSLILQNLHPPTGVVTEISPAWLRPCMRLLMDASLDVGSGIPYTASVILSVLRDIRSTESLLKALDLYPVRTTKIRENLLYTLGNLKEPCLVQAAGRVLNSPNILTSQDHEEAAWAANLIDQKVEAVQALGRVGLPSLQVLSPLLASVSHPSDTIKTHLAWSLGEIGKAQKDRLGGVDTGIIITLLKLLGIKNKDSFIESVSALKKMGCPEFLHSLYLYDIGAVSILGVKPAQRGLYELSETLHYLIKTKGRAIMAVNGDSGTGKTYFCEAIKDGFGNIRPEEILYLMRDRKKDQAIFNHILGLEWLKKYIDPVYYQGYPDSQEAEDPETYLSRFLEAQADRKLIILDGCRDRHYFQRIIDRFYEKGLLDVAVNFRAAHSTRRENLEEREMALESIKTHLSFLEEPALEDTLFYQQGNVLIYDLDNSAPNRLSHEEIQELFQKPHVDHWGDLILLGDFPKDSLTCKLDLGSPTVEKDRFDYESEAMPEAASREFAVEERKFQIVLNQDLESQPCFLGYIPLSDIKPRQIRLYAQDQIAGLGEAGHAFVLTFVDNRIFHTRIGSSRGLTLLGRDMFIIDNQGELLRLSFERGQATRFTSCFPPVMCLDTRLKDTVVTGHTDGSLRIWDFTQVRISRIAAHDTPIKDLTLDDWGRVYSTGSDGLLKRWDLRQNTMFTASGLGYTQRTKRYPGGKILVESDALYLLDPENESFQALSLPPDAEISDISVYPDGRIVTALSDNIGVFAPGKAFCKLSLIKAHARTTFGCLTLGPKILTCGRESDELYDLRISGAEFFVKHESNKLSLQA
ncbi:MAG: WD40 repeat domain-containing protein [Candidatus Aminicenantaceae bacterium]